MTKSGRGVWWNVIPIDQAGPAVVIQLVKDAPKNVNNLERYIVERALKGCPDCISAILECPDDPVLQHEVVELK